VCYSPDENDDDFVLDVGEGLRRFEAIANQTHLSAPGFFATSECPLHPRNGAASMSREVMKGGANSRPIEAFARR
jgi:hypothetical protein